ncbi:hypothetical protein FisN_2Hh242 [Fistulifera solaris]|uniref:Uncharacterized protein n=1 Tax=Fistulifera solaris TaxID=1519565 RepID=A0A1Z5JF80_FISSO|nr:hypothetical protein FisN_2Hh242 [Fistulifera solaris]|eukprot:GAX12411.1 hypothetical protein FisN_2Hh242 [Fistulifera solaris]
MIHLSHRSVALPLLVSIFRVGPAVAFSSLTRPPHRSLSRLKARGDYAGYHVTYDIDGTHISVPEFYVPQALLEWGQAPSALEVIVSENEDDTRHVLTVLPETGCGLDNLEVLQRRETLGTPLWKTNENIAASVYVSSSRLECVFAQPNNHRSRVVLNCDVSTGSLQKPISLYLERKISETSTEGRRADGGGLDARSVSGWVGPELRALESSLNQFCIPTNLAALDGNIKHAFGLPGNVTVACDTDEKALTLWVNQAYGDQSRWIELKCRNNEWKARSWLDTITSDAT